MKLAVAFLCYNDSSSRYLEDFLPSLERACMEAGGDIVIYAGDNSDEGKRENHEMIREYNENSSFPITYIGFGNNLGFAKGFNRLIERSIADSCEAFLMLNPDMILDNRMISLLLARLEENRDLAGAYPLLYQWNFDSREKTQVIDTCGIGLKPGLRFYDIGQGSSLLPSTKAIGPSGAAAMFRLSALESVKDEHGYFDERFFMYKEDCDLAYRLHHQGLKSSFLPEAIAFHDRTAASKGGILQTFDDWRGRSRKTRIWSFVNQHLIYAKHVKSEPLFSRLLVYGFIIFYAIFSLLLAQFLLKSYPVILQRFRHLD